MIIKPLWLSVTIRLVLVVAAFFVSAIACAFLLALWMSK